MQIMRTVKSCILIILLGHCATSSKAQRSSLYFKEVADLTASQKATLQKFRASVENLLPHDYMKEDLYLIRFLRSKDFRLRDSISAIKEAMEWRKLNAMDGIESEDFSEFERDFPLYFDATDTEGRVVMEGHFGDWPIRTAVLAGKLPKLKRYGVRGIELATRKVREIQATGKNVTQWTMLLNMASFSIQNNACPSCLPYYLNFVGSYEKYYPFSVGHMVFVNTPEAFEIVLNLVRPLMNGQTRKVMKIFGYDQNKWMPYVHQHFPPQRISEWFGGSKVRAERLK